ncbi:MAG: ATP-binding protein [Dissulfurispiraceae bacterium]
MKGYFVIVGSLIVIVSVLITLNIFFQQSLQVEMAEQFNKQQLILSKSIAESISAYVSSMRVEVLAISQVMTRIDMKSGKDFNWLTTGVVRNKGLIKTHIGILDNRSNMVFSDQSENQSTIVVSEIFQKGTAIQAGKVETVTTPSVVYVLSPIYEGNRLKNIVFLSLSINEVANYFIGEVSSGSTGHASILDKKGNLLYHHPPQTVMAGGNIYNAQSHCFRCHTSFTLEKRIVEGQEGAHGRYIAPYGDDKIIAYSVADPGVLSWIIAISAQYTEVTHTTKESMKLYSYLIISILSTTIVVSALLILFNKKRIQAAEIEKRQEEMEKYAVELEEKVNVRTAELVSEKEKLNTIVSAIGCGILLFDEQGTIQWANQMFKDIAGTDVIGRHFEDLCQEWHISGAHSTTNNVETTLMTNLFGQKGKYYQVITAPVEGVDGQVHGYIRLIQDVTEIKKMEEQMTNSEKLASIGRLAAGIAHEIGNPLTSIFSFVQILREVEEDDFKKDSLQTIYFHINRISEILKQMSGFTKMPIGEPKTCQINDIIETSINLIQYDKKAKDISIVKEFSPFLPELLIDCNQLSQIFVNLILNAFDAMPAGGTLSVKSFVREGDIVIQFEDTGSGIPKENLIKIFDPFYTTKEKGTGLGLAVSYSIVKKMNGSLTVESEPSKGSIFTITIPIQEHRGE